MRLEVARDLKESLAKVSDSVLQDGDPRYALIPTTPYELPDGTVVEVNIERFQIAEVLFQPAAMTESDVFRSAAPDSVFGMSRSVDSIPKVVGTRRVHPAAVFHCVTLVLYYSCRSMYLLWWTHVFVSSTPFFSFIHSLTHAIIAFVSYVYTQPTQWFVVTLSCR
jgi:hypothetical protein